MAFFHNSLSPRNTFVKIAILKTNHEKRNHWCHLFINLFVYLFLSAFICYGLRRKIRGELAMSQGIVDSILVVNRIGRRFWDPNWGLYWQCFSSQKMGQPRSSVFLQEFVRIYVFWRYPFGMRAKRGLSSLNFIYFLCINISLFS